MDKEQPIAINHLTTEARNPASTHIDSLSAIEIVRLMNQQDAQIAEAVGKQADVIAQAVDVIAERLRDGGRLIYKKTTNKKKKS